MNLYRGLTGYDIASRIERAVDERLNHGADWFTERVENTLIGCAVLVFVVLGIISVAQWIWSMQ